MPVPQNINPVDSYVLTIEGGDQLLALTVEAALCADHPAFYWPPKPGEQHAYARLRITVASIPGVVAPSVTGTARADASSGLLSYHWDTSPYPWKLTR